MPRRPPTSTRPATLFPYTTLFRSGTILATQRSPASRHLPFSANISRPFPCDSATSAVCSPHRAGYSSIASTPMAPTDSRSGACPHAWFLRYRAARSRGSKNISTAREPPDSINPKWSRIDDAGSGPTDWGELMKEGDEKLQRLTGKEDGNAEGRERGGTKVENTG